MVHILILLTLLFSGLRREDTGFAEDSSRLDTVEEQSLVSDFLFHFAISSLFLIQFN